MRLDISQDAALPLQLDLSSPSNLEQFALSDMVSQGGIS